MSEFVTDSHPLIWHLTKDGRLSERCQEIFTGADAGNHTVWVPAVVVVEMVYLVEKGRFPTSLVSQVNELLKPPTLNYHLAFLNFEALQALQRVDRTIVPEMPDRIVAAIALSLEIPLLSRDHVMPKVENLEVIW